MGQPKFIPSNQTRGFRQIATIPLVQDNTQVVLDIPRGPHIESAFIRVAGSANITVTATAVRNDAAARFLRRADWVLNSNVTLDSVTGMQIKQGYVTRRQNPTNLNPAGFGISVQPFSAIHILDRCLMDMARPKDTLLKTDVGVSNNQLRLQFGALADMFTGTPTIGYTNVSASVWVTDYQEARDGNGDTPSPGYYIKRSGGSFGFSGAANNQQIKLSTGNRLRLVSFRVLNATTGEPDITLVSRVRVQRAGDTRVDMLLTDLLAANQSGYGAPLMTGQAVIDFANPGVIGARYAEFWPIPTSADTFLIVDTTAACTIETLVIEGVDLVGP